ncbi:acetyl esterase/lipase [Prosthecobacter fusiformis]|uniref:Acetyl esterase/lipase n=1 Tax=Prosthecobacter fusiformis TaxID=48464 RepID=A0A4R7RP91_9BACT|nr:alpha/beta hydrolase [Prosthecobacter fusiformis]TDU66446.1 acetyl esterase/lipase [Prosthecobacter fusiformis]
MKNFTRSSIPRIAKGAAGIAAMLLTCGSLTAQTETPAASVAVPNPQMQAVLDELTALNPKPLETLTPAEARKQPGPADAVASLIKKRDIKAPEEVADVENETFKYGDVDVKVRIYTPAGEGPFPMVLYIHGGGWVIADLDTYDATPRALCNAGGMVVVSTHYRQAPEHKFPAAHDDVFAAYQWLLKNAKELNGDASRVAVVGESAGGNLAAGVSLMAARQGLPLPRHQVLVYPVTDATTMDTPSYREHANAKPLNLPMMQWFAKHTLASPADAKDPLLSIALAGAALKSCPPTTIITADIDPLRSDGEKLAAALKEQGVTVTLKNYEGVTHEFFGMAAVVDSARAAISFASNQLTAAFAQKMLPIRKTAAE